MPFSTYFTENSINGSASVTASESDGAITIELNTLAPANLLGNSTISAAVPTAVPLDTDAFFFSGGALAPVIAPAGGILKDSPTVGQGFQVDATFMQVIGTTITASQFKAMRASPVPLIGSVWAWTDTAIIVSDCILQLTGNTTAYTGGGDVYIQYGAPASGPAASDSLPAASITGLTNNQFVRIPCLGFPSAVNKTAINETGVYLTCNIAEFADGDGSFNVFLRYYLIPTNG